MNVLAIIPARGGSKGIPKKNIYPLCGKPLIAWTIEAVNGSRYISRTILSSDSAEIIEVAGRYGIEAPFVRPKELAEDDTPALPVIRHAVDWLKENEDYTPDYIVLLQPTSPLRTSRHIDEALEKLIHSDADSIVSVVKTPHQYNPYSIMEMKDGFLKPFLKYDERKNIRQLKPVFYARNGAAIYAFTYECLMKKNSIFGDKILGYEMSREESVDVDDVLDLRICELLIKNHK
ncbi:MAG: acylneuraminate cytidylyltransferase family protein [Desulfobulbaceae bacterium]|nr:acylneuraminate cytidylyltransferase family protein [Desulfobulbaceae bacterium]